MASDQSGEDKRAPLLEDEKGNITEQFVSFERFQGDAASVLGAGTSLIFSTLSTYWRIAAKTFAKACGVAIGWSWSVALQQTFSEALVPEALNIVAGIVYALAMSLLTAWMIQWISRHQADPNDVEFGKFGRNSRELLLVVQPMVLAWAWKDALRGSLWEHLPKDDPVQTFGYRLLFALFCTVTVAFVVTQMAEMIKRSAEGHRSIADQSYPVVLMSMMSAAFGLFLAWCWNETAASGSMMISDGRATESLALTIYALLLTAAATFATLVLGNHAQSLREDATPDLSEEEGAAPEEPMPVFSSVLPLWVKFVDLISASLGYMVGWAWSDAFECVFLHTVSITDVKLLYLVYALAVSAAAILYTSHVAEIVDDPNVPAGVKQYATLFLNALGFMVGWAWKAYIQYFVAMLPTGGGQVFAQYFQALVATVVACVVYHKLRVWEAQSQASDVEKHIEQVTNAAGSTMD